ncbi:MAG: sigma-54-dependent sensor transcriptional regulator [Deltaproteobacteria bacterium]|nr:sigma-54-dependent sensor transcriptional regulator [Deltaproteobacteria bacterium]MBP2685838.1 sigma-54-dependent sensor transcriptional regulator [Deltaproteobacteria bacterium]
MKPDSIPAVAILAPPRRSLEERLQFETLLADLSARFVNLPAPQVDIAIEDAQRRVCERLGLDASLLWQMSPDHPGSMSLTHSHLPPGFPPVPEVWDCKESFPWALERFLGGETIILSRLTDAPPEAARDVELVRHYGVKSVVAIPLSVGGDTPFGALNFGVTREERDWPPELVTRLKLVALVFANALARKHDEQALRERKAQLRQMLEEVRRLRDRLEKENVYLREQLRRDDGHEHIVGESEAIKKMLAQARRVAPTDTAVLITGETGSGKELLAHAIHDMSGRSGKTMVIVNCAALPPALIESELFGREKGAYTGAMTRQTGRFEVADGSTLLLDEIGDLTLDLQVKLLRVLQDGRFERLGSNRTLTADVRLIAATNHDLGVMVRDGRFREDLFHRLDVFPIEVPPLRARVSDIPLLVWRFVQEFNRKMGKSIDSIPRQTMERLKQYPWPGNVRELRNQIERAMIVSDGRSLTIDLPAGAPGSTSIPVTLEEVERKHILDVLGRVHWRISGKKGAAGILGLCPTTLHSRMKKLGISRPNP